MRAYAISCHAYTPALASRQNFLPARIYKNCEFSHSSKVTWEAMHGAATMLGKPRCAASHMLHAPSNPVGGLHAKQVRELLSQQAGGIEPAHHVAMVRTSCGYDSRQRQMKCKRPSNTLPLT